MSGNIHPNSQTTTQVRTLQPLTITTSDNPSTGNRTFLLSPSPTTSTDSYRPWMGTTDVAAELRGSFTPPSPVSSTASHRSSNGTGEVPSQLHTLGGFPWQIPGDSGAGYEAPDLDNDSSLSSIPSGSSTDVSYSTLASSTTTTISSASSISCCCCALRPLLTRALHTTTTRVRNTFTHHDPSSPPLYKTHRSISIETSLLQIHLHTLHTTPLRFLHWSFGYFSLHRGGSNARVQFPEEHYAHLPIRAVALLVAMDLEEGALWVGGDGVEREVAESLGVEVRGLVEECVL